VISRVTQSVYSLQLLVQWCCAFPTCCSLASQHLIGLVPPFAACGLDRFFSTICLLKCPFDSKLLMLACYRLCTSQGVYAVFGRKPEALGASPYCKDPIFVQFVVQVRYAYTCNYRSLCYPQLHFVQLPFVFATTTQSIMHVCLQE
jgi:hypothetical protein